MPSQISLQQADDLLKKHGIWNDKMRGELASALDGAANSEREMCASLLDMAAKQEFTKGKVFLWWNRSKASLLFGLAALVRGGGGAPVSDEEDEYLEDAQSTEFIEEEAIEEEQEDAKRL